MSHWRELPCTEGHPKEVHPVLQENGQRKYGPPEDWQGPPPPKGTEVFISRLPRQCLENVLCPVFSAAGVLYELRLMMDFSGYNRGYGFVKYATREAALRAIHMLNNTCIIDKSAPIIVEESLDNCRLFISPLPPHCTNGDVMSSVDCLLEGVKSAQVIRSKTKKHLFCFLEFENHRMAAMARRTLLSSGIPGWVGDLTVDWAVPEGKNVPQNKQRHKLLLKNLTQGHSDDEIYYILHEITVNMNAVISVKKNKGLGIVELSSRSVGDYMIARLNGIEYNGGTLSVTWANPRRGPRKSSESSDWSFHQRSAYSRRSFDGSGRSSTQDSSRHWATCSTVTDTFMSSGPVSPDVTIQKYTPSPPSAYRSASSSPCEERYFSTDVKVDLNSLFPDEQARYPAPSGRPDGWAEAEDQKQDSWFQKEQRADISLPDPGSHHLPHSTDTLTPPMSDDDSTLHYDGSLPCWFPDDATAYLPFLQPKDNTLNEPLAYEVVPNGGDCLTLNRLCEALYACGPLPNDSRLKTVSTDAHPAVYGRPASNGHPDVCCLPATNDESLSHNQIAVDAHNSACGAISRPSFFYKREISSYEEYKQFKAFVGPLLEKYPDSSFEILKSVCATFGWGELKFRLDSKIGSEVKALIYFDEPYRPIYETTYYYISAHAAVNQAAYWLFQNYILHEGNFKIFQDAYKSRN